MHAHGRGRHGFESSARAAPFFSSLTACYNVRTCSVVTRLWHCGNNFKSKVFATLWLLSDKVVTIDNHNLLTRLSQPCHNLVISIWVVQCNYQNGQLYILASSIVKKNCWNISVASNVTDSVLERKRDVSLKLETYMVTIQYRTSK